MSKFVLADGSASIEGELSLLAEKEYTMPLSKKDTTESLKTALYELLMYADTVKNQNNTIVLLAKKHAKHNKKQENQIGKMREALQYFVDRVDNGTARSARTYNMYKELLGGLDDA